LKEHNPVVRINFCNWFHRSVHDGEVDPQLVFFSDEAWFSLCGEVISQNNQYWSAENTRLIHEFLIHGKKIGVWYAISAHRITGCFMTIQLMLSGMYKQHPKPIFRRANRRRKAIQDSATAHMVYISLEAVQEVFSDCIISFGLWPPHSPDLTPCDFYLWGNLKDKVYKTNPHTLEKLRNNICCKISAISGEELQRVNTNMFRRDTECIQSGRQHFQHLL
jgi:hypothetical protein